jgi:hypothetical protein
MRLGALLALTFVLTLQAQQADRPPARSRDASRAQSRDDLHKSFFQTQASRFTVHFEGGEDYELATRTLAVLDAAYERIGAALVHFPTQPITVILYTQQQFQDVTRAPAWAAGAFDGRIRIPIRGALASPDELARVLSHELAHAMIHTIAPSRVPFWLNEGLAVIFEPQGAVWSDAELARAPERLRFERLAGSFRGLSAAEARIAYAQSARLARRLLDDAGGPTVVTILRDLGAGQSFEAAYEQRLGLPLETFLRTLEPPSLSAGTP